MSWQEKLPRYLLTSNLNFDCLELSKTYPEKEDLNSDIVIIKFKNPLFYKDFLKSKISLNKLKACLKKSDYQYFNSFYLNQKTDIAFPNSKMQHTDFVPGIFGITKFYKRKLVQAIKYSLSFLSPFKVIIAAKNEKILAPWCQEIVKNTDLVLFQWGQATFWYQENKLRKIRQVSLLSERGQRMANFVDSVFLLPEQLKKDFDITSWETKIIAQAYCVDRNHIVAKSDLDFNSFAVNALLLKLAKAKPQKPCRSDSLLDVYYKYQVPTPKGVIAVPDDLLNRLKAIAVKLSNQYEQPFRASQELIFQHGDFKDQNLLLTKTGLICIDWEWCCWTSVIGFDFLNYHYPALSEKETKVDLWLNLFNSMENNQQEKMLKLAFGQLFNEQDWSQAILSFWLLKMARNCHFGKIWSEKVLLPSLEYLENR